MPWEETEPGWIDRGSVRAVGASQRLNARAQGIDLAAGGGDLARL